MNKDALTFWNNYWKEKDLTPPENYTAWQFGSEPDTLAQLVCDRKKTATCSNHTLYQVENEPLPAVGEYSIILDSQDKPVVIIKTIEVTILPMNEVPEEFAVAEGEGDGSYEYWWREHKKIFTQEMKELNKPFQEDMLLVCERFEVVD
ncbi:RNA-binding protein [Paraliobacillus quinghaiensis]|uniref:RNA-binding protein n=1 Tax=Paraliobacillus quinghaiensis TaxID=470815 RepID=A0A917TN53_9BACI|nr:ASCH domain-containing protein [Paraliobacillus quinghaiensis]GGM28341.1 RNA-binding protein [Paraliobacillus quinghaiensis]